jgi:hypothetical protein
MAAVIVLLSRGTTTCISGWESDSKGGCKIERLHVAFLVTEMDEEKLIFEGNCPYLCQSLRKVWKERKPRTGAFSLLK